jgi:hypothetical protein
MTQGEQPWGSAAFALLRRLSGGVVAEDDRAELIRRLSEVLTVIEHRRIDTWVLARIDADARRQGISRTAWLQMAAGKDRG